jgi:two-component system, chemotaxis family, chemotaxis protein CheY
MFPKKTRILIADDAEIIRQVIQQYFVDLGYEDVEAVEDGEKAWERLRQAQNEGNPFELVLSDFTMPKMTGFDLLKQVRSNPAFREVPFILLSAESDRERVMEAIQLGVSQFVVKPFNFATFTEALKTAYRRK